MSNNECSNCGNADSSKFASSKRGIKVYCCICGFSWQKNSSRFDTRYTAGVLTRLNEQISILEKENALLRFYLPSDAIEKVDLIIGNNSDGAA